MKFPYGISDFHKLITEDYFYVDRTDRIPVIEEMGEQLLFLRPRRFGKSLWLSTLANYYDVARAGEFERLFGHLAVGQNPTPRHNQYFVLRWDFSLVAAYGDANEIAQALHRHVNGRIQDFVTYYQQMLPGPIEIHPTDALVSLQSVLTSISQTPHKLYLLIDEYDNFANELAMSGQPTGKARYDALLRGEGALKTLFKAVKGATSGFGLDRVFITGVSPIVLSDLTSGYNSARNIYLQPALNDLCGFTEVEIADALSQVADACRFSASQTAEALEMMRTFYNGYRFCEEPAPPVYNPTLALYFMQEFQQNCRNPSHMLDSNLAMDRGKLAYIASLPDGGQVLLDAVQEEPPLALSVLADRFGVEDMLTAAKDAPFMASFLYYFGVLTFGGRTSLGHLILRIPNLVARKLYVERVQDMLLPDVRAQDAGRQATDQFLLSGDLGPVCAFVEQRYFRVFDNRDYRWANELTVKTVFLTLLFNDIAYIMDSEPALARAYADLSMIVRPEMRQYALPDLLFEFKYVALSEAGMTAEQVRGLTAETLRAVPVVAPRVAEATARLAEYRTALQAKYGDRLRLRCYAVVSLGFERLVWEECR